MAYTCGKGRPTREQLLNWLELRTRALREIRSKCPDTEASKIAGHALCIGPSDKWLLIEWLLDAREDPDGV